MRTILYIKGTDSYQNRRKLAGVADYARAHHWNLQTIPEGSSMSEARKLCRLWKPDGIIVNLNTSTEETFTWSFKDTPTLFFHNPSKPADCIACDSVATAECAARELLALQLAQYAFLPWRKHTNWSDIRQKTFTDLMALHDETVSPAPTQSANESPSDYLTKLARWLQKQPRPLGLFAANDNMAALAVSACHMVGLSVPEDVAIVGVDNDPETCESCITTISSVGFDFYAAGQLAARTLERMITRPSAARVYLTYPPLGVVRRESTRRLSQQDAAASSALERIRREACHGLTAAQVLAGFGCSRRLAEMRFRRAAGRSVLEEIRAVRLEKAKELLAEGGRKLDYIANLCGYKSLAAFSIFFKDETGVPPSQWNCQRPQSRGMSPDPS